MAPMGAALSDADLAAVLTYIRTSWGNKAGEVTGDDVKYPRGSWRSSAADEWRPVEDDAGINLRLGVPNR